MIKTASLEDLKSVVSLACALWPAHTAFEMQDEIQKLLVDQSAAIALCIHGDRPIGFAQCQLRNDYVEGTESSPVGYLEGIYVEPAYRRAGGCAPAAAAL